MRVYVEGVGLLGPGLRDWKSGADVLAGRTSYVKAATEVTPSALLPSTERRRTGVPVHLALAAGHQAFLNCGRDPAQTATVFTASSGDGQILHQMCEALVLPEREVSPTKFHNSVHNAPAGYWSIAVHCMQPSTSLCCYDGSFAAGLLEAATQTAVGNRATALIAYDSLYVPPIHAERPLLDSFAVALVITPTRTDAAFAALDIAYVAGRAALTRMSDPGLDDVRAGIPAARSLPLLATLARKAQADLVLEYLSDAHLQIKVAPCA
jgi:hypothetical protein